MRTNEERLLQVTIAVVVVAACLCPLTLATPLLDPDEGLHAAIAQEMVETGSYFVPRFLGETFQDKPILYFLAQAASLRLIGMTEFAVRLPGVLFALFGVWTTGLCGTRMFNSRVGLLAVLVSLTSLLPMAMMQAPIHDMALVPFTNLFMLGLYGLSEESNPTRPVRLFALAAGSVCFALLTKGLIGIAVVSAGYFVYLLLERRLVIRTLWPWLAIVGIGSLLALPWFGLMELNEPGYLRYYFLERHILGYATSSQTHGHEPWYYYLLPLTLGTLPWIAHAAPAAVEFFRPKQPRTAHDPRRFLVSWFMGGLLFLSCAHSKLVTYALPLFPAVALCVADVWDRFLDQRLSARSRVGVSRAFELGALVGMAAPFAILAGCRVHFGFNPSVYSWVMALVLSGSSLAVLIHFRCGGQLTALAGGAVWMALLLTFVVADPLQHIAHSYSLRRLATSTVNRIKPEQPVVVIGDRSGSFVFYLSPAHRQQLRRRGSVFLSARAALLQQGRDPARYVIPTRKALEEYPQLKQLITAGHRTTTAADLRQTTLLAEDPPHDTDRQ